MFGCVLFHLRSHACPLLFALLCESGTDNRYVTAIVDRIAEDLLDLDGPEVLGRLQHLGNLHLEAVCSVVIIGVCRCLLWWMLWWTC